MSGVEDSTTVDVVAEGAGGECVLAMVEERPWGSDPGQESQLREKFNTYATFVHSGELVEKYPDADGKRVVIQLDCVDEPTGEILATLEKTNTQLARLGIELVVNVRG